MTKSRSPLPTMDEIVSFLNENQGKAGKREIARAFQVKGDDKVKLKRILKDMKESGKIEKSGSSKKMVTADGLPQMCPSEITGIDSDGELVARPLNWTKPTTPPQILITDLGKLRPPPKEGDFVVLKLTPKGKRFYHGAVVRRLTEKPNRVVGLFDTTSGKGGKILSVDRRLHQDYLVEREHTGNAKNGDVVIAEVIGSSFHQHSRKAKVLEVIGKASAPHAASLIAIHLHGIPTEFTEAALKEAAKAKIPPLKNRVDLRDIPLVTIDGEDARDFDDAIFAEPDTNKDNKDGWHLIVAIADVAYFVRPNDALDKTARERGNSVYFPDRFVPMLPEKLSSDLCSLKPNVDRPCMAVHLWINKQGRILSYKFVRAMMRSAARLNYHEVQKVFDGDMLEMNDELRHHLLDLQGAYKCLAAAREKRGALELDVIEREITLNEQGQIADISPRERLDSHKTVEEFMIAANVAAADQLEEKDMPAMYRVHESPSAEKIDALQTFLGTIGIRAGKNGQMGHQDFNHVLEAAKDTTRSFMINELVLRSQSQARYSPENMGHFGLALEKYAHFTSPIRRYSDLLVHRALISALNLGGDGLIDSEGRMTIDLDDIADHISATERRAASAERDAEERYLSAYLKDRIGEKFSGIINGVNRFGLFVVIDDIGAEGLIPISTLPNDYYVYDESSHRLVGSGTGNAYELGERVQMILAEATPVTGGLLFHLLDSGNRKTNDKGHHQKPRHKFKDKKKFKDHSKSKKKKRK